MLCGMEGYAQAHVIVHGRVQGVWFRARTREMARGLRLRGWVRNRPDGTVEAVFEGERQPVMQAVAWCYRGPDLAQVDSVDVDWREPTGEFTAFDVRW
jgi:acylphosphatase